MKAFSEQSWLRDEIFWVSGFFLIWARSKISKSRGSESEFENQEKILEISKSRGSGSGYENLEKIGIYF